MNSDGGKTLSSAGPRGAFILLSEQRTGSNLLMAGLAQHPNVLSFQEALNKKFTRPRLFSDDPEERKRINKIRRDSRDRFLLEYLYNWKLHGTDRYIGFKCQYQNLRGAKGRMVASALNAVDGLLVVHLIRDNMFDRFVSKKNAEITGRYWAKGDGPKNKRPDPYPVKYEEALADFKRYEREQKLFEGFFSTKRIIRLKYEDLVADYPGTIGRILAGMGLEPIHCAPKSSKQSRPARLQIQNYEELRRCFAGTRYERFFVET